MARNFRFYRKKRGHRSTGSKTAGSLGEALFFSTFLLLGIGGVVLIFATLVIPEWRANHVFVETDCTVLDKRVGTRATEAGEESYRPEVQIQYRVDDGLYTAWTYDIRGGYTSDEEAAQSPLEQFEVGQAYACWHDPQHPETAVLVRGYSGWFWLAFAVPVSFLLTGGAGLAYTVLTWGKSAERQAALAKRASRIDLLEKIRRVSRNYPNIPAGTQITDSPGTRLTFRLPPAVSPAWSLIAWLLAAVLWNAVLAPFAVIVVNGFLAGQPEWTMTAFLLPFLAIGAGLGVVFFRQLLVATGVGPTYVEISELPLHPGGKYNLFLSQAGRLKMNSLEILLVCDEETTFRHGTNTRTETNRVYQQIVLRQEGFEIRSGVPFEAQCEISVPAGAMHSFRSEHNELLWKIVVKGDIARWPSFERTFPVLVHPKPNSKATNGNGKVTNGKAARR